MRVHWILASILACAPFALHAQMQAPETPVQLVRDVVYNELHDHQRHGYWRYWIERHTPKETRLEDQVETADGPVNRLTLTDGAERRVLAVGDTFELGQPRSREFSNETAQECRYVVVVTRKSTA